METRKLTKEELATIYEPNADEDNRSPGVICWIAVGILIVVGAVFFFT